MHPSILLIKSKEINNRRMGTGFVVHQDSFGSYILTCFHVLNDVQEAEIEGFDIEIIAKGSAEHIDLALVYVKGLFRTPLELGEKKCSNKEVELIGYSSFSAKVHQCKSRAAHILDDVSLTNIENGIQIKGVQIIADDHSEIEPGNSGSPLFCKSTGKVMAVVTNNRGVKEGYAVSIIHLQDIWEEMPPLLLEDDVSPFVGLSAFSIKESHLFFGRAKETGEIFDKLQKQGLVAVVGDSGSGKSSVIKAGVIPKYLNRELLESEENEEKHTFHLIEMRPANNPFNELANSLGHIDAILKFNLEDISHLKKILKSKKSEDILTAFESIFRENKVTLLLYIDQFEELFTLCDNALEKTFIETLLYLLAQKSSNLNIKIIFTMRRDYYNLIAEYERFYEQTQVSKYTLLRMKNDQIKECIEKPLLKTSIEKNQINIFSKAVLKDMGDESSELTLLQIALTQTWEHKEEHANNLLATYHEIGEVSGALAKLADNTWKILSSVEQKILQYIFIRIIKPNDTGGVTRRLADKNEFSVDAWGLAQKLSSALDSQGSSAKEKNAQLGRLLKIKGKEGAVLELNHEALIRQWPKYQVWLKAVSKDDLKRSHDYVMEQNKIYQTHGKKKKFLLRGHALERSEKLLAKEYQEYLSDEEVSYIKKALLYQRVTWGIIGSTFLLVCILLGFLYVSNQEKEEVSDKLVSLIEPSVNRAIEPLMTPPFIPRDINFSNTIFTFMVDTFKADKDKEEIVSKSWFGKGMVLRYSNKPLEAIAMYASLVTYFKGSTNPMVLNYVVRGWFNQAKVLESIDKEEAFQVYFELIEHFKFSKNEEILELVMDSWVNQGVLLDETRLHKNRSIEVLEGFLEHFKKNEKIVKQKLDAYITLSMLSLMNKEFENATVYINDGYNLEKDHTLLNLNLFSAYVLLGRMKEAKKIYRKNIGRKFYEISWKDLVHNDIVTFREHGIDCIGFKEVLNW